MNTANFIQTRPFEMATLREYFDLDFPRTGQWFTDLTMSAGEQEATAKFCVHWDFDAGAKYISCFLPRTCQPRDFLYTLISDYERWLLKSNDVEMAMSYLESRRLSSKSLTFTKRFFIYYDGNIDEGLEHQLYDQAAQRGLLFELRTATWALRRQALEIPLAFICHDSADKDEIARPLAIELAKLACPVWFDEFSLQMGDSLREKIEHGLKEAKKIVLVITPSFLNNERWTKREFESIFTRETIKNEKVILPIWHNVTQEQVYKYSPSLADRFARQWNLGKEVVASEIRRIILGN